MCVCVRTAASFHKTIDKRAPLAGRCSGSRREKRGGKEKIFFIIIINDQIVPRNEATVCKRTCLNQPTGA